MKTTKTYISRSGIIWCIPFLIGMIMLISGIFEQEAYGKHYSFEEITPDSIQIGDYVAGDITSFLVTGDTYITAVSAEYNSSQVYNVPVGDGYYIRVLVSNPLTQQNLFDNMNGSSKKVGFSGVVTSSPIGFNDGWYRQVIGFDPSRVIQDVVIQQISTNWSITRSLLGLEIVVICLIFRLSGVLPPILSREEEEAYLQAKKYTRSHNIEYELEHERKKLKTLEERMVQLQKEYRLGLVLLLLSVLGLAFASSVSQIYPNVFPKLQTLLFSLPSILILMLGGNMVYQYLKHAPGKLSRYYSGIKNYIPLPLEIEKCKLNIEALEEKLAQENALGPIYCDEIIYADF
ncbi:MAG: hypothetical protein IKK33_02905 [Lachnospiraceae bacterium]|nr:hypothetical protein [Lachnospiraceae bacterium]